MIQALWSGARWAFPCVLLLFNLHSEANAQQGQAHEYREVHLGMEVRLELTGDKQATDQAAELAFGLIDSLDMVFSDWREESELRQLEKQPVGWWIPISPELRDVFSLSLKIAAATDGAFDPTVGPLTRLWRTAKSTGVEPRESVRKAAAKRVDWRNLHLDSANSRVRMTTKEMEFDLGAIAKGWILDRAGDTLKSLGVESALLVAGGDILVTAAPPGTAGWRIMIGDSLRIIHDLAISTSGPTEQWRRDQNGLLRSHVIDTKVGRGTVSRSAVTVIARSAATSDALATTLTLVPIKDQWRLMAKFGVMELIER